MSYCTTADIEKRLTQTELRQLTDLDGNGTVNADVVAAAIERADALIDSYLARRYDVPLETVPDVVQSASADLAIYLLQKDRQSVTEDVKNSHDDWIHWLKDVAKGTATLGIEPPPGESSAGAGGQFDSKTKRFDRDDLDGW